VHHAFVDGIGTAWYNIWDERNKEYYQVQAAHLRPIGAEEVAPISPGAAGKEIRIDLQRQRLVCYEGQRPVFTTRIATGSFEGTTPIGTHVIERKTPSRHMASNLEGNAFDLPGVPWVCYIAWTGVSIHGTYWHHNYGTPQSHGCINLTPEAALWVYRWTDPVVPVGEDYVETDGTTVVIF
jgi:lipoprotein-anchoring transpeptidase ErfK/SrfK